MASESIVADSADNCCSSYWLDVTVASTFAALDKDFAYIHLVHRTEEGISGIMGGIMGGICEAGCCGCHTVIWRRRRRLAPVLGGQRKLYKGLGGGGGGKYFPPGSTKKRYLRAKEIVRVFLCLFFE